MIAHRNTFQRLPTVREMCRKFRWKSPNAAQRHLHEMERKGLVRREVKGMARGWIPAFALELTPEALTR